MKLLLIFLLSIGLIGCHGTSSEQLCYEANRAVAESVQKRSETRGHVSDEWFNAYMAARSWRESECTSLTDWLLQKLKIIFSASQEAPSSSKW
jgi:hypothetical protein